MINSKNFQGRKSLINSQDSQRAKAHPSHLLITSLPSIKTTIFTTVISQGRSKVRKSGGACSTGCGECVPLVEIGLTDLQKTGVAEAPQALPPWRRAC